MAQSYWPFVGTDTTETQYSELFRRLVESGVWGGANDSKLKAYGDSSGLFIKLPAGAPDYAFVRGHMYQSDTAIVSTAVTPGSVGARTDLFVLRFDPALSTIVPAVIAGTSGSPGIVPAPTQTDTGIYELPLATIAMGASASTVTAGMVTDVRKFSSHLFGNWTTANRPATPRDGQPGYNETLAVPEYWDAVAAAWKPFVITAVTASMLSTGEQHNLEAGNSLKVAGHILTVSLASGGAPSSPADKDVWISY